MDERKIANLKEVAVLVGCTFVCATIAGFFLYAPMRTEKFWLGERGWLEVAAPIGTVVAATIAAWLAWRNYAAGQQRDTNERFQKGVELVDGDSTAKRTAGIIVLEDLATEGAPGRHQRWIREFLVSAVETWSDERRRKLPATIPPAFKFPKTDHAPVRALKALAKLSVEETAGHQIGYLYLADVTFTGQSLANFDISNSHVIETWFQQCELKGLKLRGRFVGETAFLDCDLSHAQLHGVATTAAKTPDIEIVDSDLSFCRINVPRGGELNLIGCQVDGLTIRGSGTLRVDDCWFRRTAPSFGRLTVDGDLTVYLARHDEHQVTDRGWKKWRPLSSDVPMSKLDMTAFDSGVFD